MPVEGVLALARRIVGDDGRCASLDQAGAEGIAVIGGVGEAEGWGEVADEFGRDWCVAAMAGADDQASGPPELVDGGMDLGGASTA